MTLEASANLVFLVSILLATMNSWHTWWTGIAGCAMFAWLFLQSQLYADVTLQGFFIVTSCYGWWHWRRGQQGEPAPIRSSSVLECLVWAGCAAVGALAYGAILHSFTDAYAPFADSMVLTFSILAQLLLMRRRIETWWCWLIVNSIAVPLYLDRGLTLTAAFYSMYWVNAVVALWRWRMLMRDQGCAGAPRMSEA